MAPPWVCEWTERALEDVRTEFDMAARTPVPPSRRPLRYPPSIECPQPTFPPLSSPRMLALRLSVRDCALAEGRKGEEIHHLVGLVRSGNCRDWHSKGPHRRADDVGLDEHTFCLFSTRYTAPALTPAPGAKRLDSLLLCTTHDFYGGEEEDRRAF